MGYDSTINIKKKNIKEISEIQKLPEGTVKSRLSRARKKLESIFLDENIRKEDLNG